MLTPDDLHGYQKRAVNHQVLNPFSALWLFMGAGKSIITLTSIVHLFKHKKIHSVLVVGPLRVVQSVWMQEALKWTHTRHLRFSLVHGTTPEKRLRALSRPADVYLINYENLFWLYKQLNHFFISRNLVPPFDMLVLDEVSKMKRHNTKRIRALAPLLRFFKYRTGLTGTPASAGLEDLFGQFLCIDGGRSLGTNYYHFVNRNFRETGYGGYKHRVTPQGERRIHEAVAPITLEMSQDDYLKLPSLMYNDIEVDLERRHRKQYEELERDLFTELDNGVELDVVNEAAKTNKCLQYSGGSVYTNTETREWHTAHNRKLDALEDVIEEAGGNPVLVAYNYRPEAERILKRFPFARNITGMSGAEFNNALADWRTGKLRMLIGHPASAGHGINGLQASCNTLVWFGLNWSLELYLQFNKRIHRQGQTRPVICHRILTVDTLDYAVLDALNDNTRTQTRLIEAVNAYRRRKENQHNRHRRAA